MKTTAGVISILLIGVIFFYSRNEQPKYYVEQKITVLGNGKLSLCTEAWDESSDEIILVRQLICFESTYEDRTGSFGVFNCYKLNDSVKKAQWLLADKCLKDWIERTKPYSPKNITETISVSSTLKNNNLPELSEKCVYFKGAEINMFNIDIKPEKDSVTIRIYEFRYDSNFRPTKNYFHMEKFYFKGAEINPNYGVITPYPEPYPYNWWVWVNKKDSIKIRLGYYDQGSKSKN